MNQIDENRRREIKKRLDKLQAQKPQANQPQVSTPAHHGPHHGDVSPHPLEDCWVPYHEWLDSKPADYKRLSDMMMSPPVNRALDPAEGNWKKLQDLRKSCPDLSRDLGKCEVTIQGDNILLSLQFSGTHPITNESGDKPKKVTIPALAYMKVNKSTKKFTELIFVFDEEALSKQVEIGPRKK